MILSAIEILKRCNYTIQYDFTAEQIANIDVTFDDLGKYTIQWDSKTQSIVSNWNNYNYKCSPMVAAVLAKLMLVQMSEFYGYPYQWIQFKYQGNMGKQFFFDIGNDDDTNQKTISLDYLAHDLITIGLNNTLIKLAKECDVWEPFKEIIKFHMNIEIA